MKYIDPRNPIVTNCINDIPIGNALIELEADINIMTIPLIESLQLHYIIPTPTILELEDRYKILPNVFG